MAVLVCAAKNRKICGYGDIVDILGFGSAAVMAELARDPSTPKATELKGDVTSGAYIRFGHSDGSARIVCVPSYSRFFGTATITLEIQ